ncbi:MAG: GntR family transcriptional regulator [Victivallaceae bacterium]
MLAGRVPAKVYNNQEYGWRKMAHLLKYEKVKNNILTDIRNGIYPPGSRIPTREELICKYSVTRTTVNQALKVLVDGGVLITSKRGGTVVTGRKMPFKVAFVSSMGEFAPSNAARGDSDSSGLLKPLLLNPASEFKLEFLDAKRVSGDLSFIGKYDVVVWSMPADAVLAKLPLYRDRVIVLNRYRNDLNFISTNHRQAVREMTEYNIAQAGDSPQLYFLSLATAEDFVSRERREGFVDACADAKVFYRICELKSFEYEDVLKSLLDIEFEAGSPIVLTAPRLAFTGAVIQMAREKGLVFQKDIFYSDFDNPYALRNTGTKIVSAVQDYAGMGRELLNVLSSFGDKKIEIFVPFQMMK